MASNGDEDIEVFMGGKRYLSFQDYKNTHTIRGIEPSQTFLDDHLAQIEAMMDQYKAENPDKKDLAFDPGKVRTLIVTPPSE